MCSKSASIVQRRGVVRAGIPAIDIGQAKIFCLLHVLKAGFHHPDMGREAALHIVAGEVNAEAVVVDMLEHPGGNALGRLAQVVAWKHPVDVRIVRRPEPLADVHGVAVHRGDYQNGLAGADFSLLLQAG